MTGGTQYCENCRHDIGAANFMIHSVHCVRRITLCTICNEAVPRTEMEQHVQDNHCIEACKLCGAQMEKWQMAQHMDKCVKRPVPCKFCELEFPFNEVDEHLFLCGVRTEKCSHCKVYVMLKDQDVHKRACENTKHAGSPIVCHRCNKNIPIDVYLQHISGCGSKFETCHKCGDMVSTKEYNTHECQDRSVPCEYCKERVSHDQYYEHNLKCGSQTEKCLKCNVTYMSREKNAHECKNINKSHGECPFCHEVVPWIDMREHESGCRLSTYSSDEDDKRPKFNPIPMHMKKQASRQSDSRSQKGQQESPIIQKLKQCGYCKERYPDLILNDHLALCGERPMKCELCLKTLLLKDKLVHETRDCEMILDANDDFAGSRNSPAGATGFTKSYEKKLKVCPYCHKKFPEIMFTDHQGVCEERPYQCNFCLKMMPFKSQMNHNLKECTYADKLKAKFSGSEGRYQKDAPVYMKAFEKSSFESNVRVCPYCNCKLSDATIAGHVQCCSVGKKKCPLCGVEIRKEDEYVHLQTCIESRKVEKSYPYTSGNKNDKDKSTLEINSRNCPHCKNRIPDAKFAEHVQHCSVGKKLCRFCGLEIPIESEILHMESCIGARNVVKEPQFQTSGNKKNKKKNKKGKQNEPVEQKSWLATNLFSMLPGRNAPVKEYTPRTDFQPYQVVQLPCEFCEELFPESLIIEHQSGCRPDLVSFGPNQEKEGYSDDHKASIGRNAGASVFSSAPMDYRDVTNTGALPKRNRFFQPDSDVVPGEFLHHNSPPKKPASGPDYYNYPSGSPDLPVQRPTTDPDYYNYATGRPDHPVQQKNDAIKQGRKVHQSQETTPNDKVGHESGDKKKNSSTSIFNFSSSSNNPSNQANSSFHREGSPMRQGFPGAQNTELKAVGAERAQKKGIIRISRNTAFVHSEDACNEVPDKYDTNNQLGKSSKNSDTESGKRDLYSSKLYCLDGDFNIPLADETSIIESEKIKSTCATRLAGKQEDSDYSANITEPWENTEDDAKNDETFGSTADNFSLSPEDSNLSDSAEHFYDAEEYLKIHNVASANGSPMDSNLDVYFQYLMKDSDELIKTNDNSVGVKESASECDTDLSNRGINTHSAALENNNYYFQTEAESLRDHFPRQSMQTESRVYNVAESGWTLNQEERKLFYGSNEEEAFRGVDWTQRKSDDKQSNTQEKEKRSMH